MTLTPQPSRASLPARVRSLARAIQDDDEPMVEAILRLSRSRRAFAPLALMIGAFAMLFDGLAQLLSNWRLTLIQILPAMWIWLAMFDLKARAFQGKSFPVLRGSVLIPIALAIVAGTIASFFLNGVFAFAIARSRPPKIAPAFAEARRRLKPILISGAVVGLLLAVATTIAPRWSRALFTLSLGAVIAVMMVCYVAVPARLIGMRTTHSRRDRLTATALGGAIGATVSTPPYLLGRLGILMLGSPVLFVPGIFVLTFGVSLQAGATGAVRAIKMGASLTAGAVPSDTPPG